MWISILINISGVQAGVAPDLSRNYACKSHQIYKTKLLMFPIFNKWC